MDVGGEPTYLSFTTSGDAGTSFSLTAFGGTPNWANYGTHTVKLTIFLENYPTIFVERFLTINIVCQVYDSANNLVVDTPMPNTTAKHAPDDPIDT